MSAAVLKEYVLRLGFDVDRQQERRFDTSILRNSSSVSGLAKGLIGAATAVAAMVAVYARSMDKLFYSSKRADATAESLKSLDFAASKAGISADTMRAMVERMASELRKNPGLVGWVESLGVPVTGRDKADVFMDIMRALKAMPYEIGAKSAEEYFGIDEATFLLLTDKLDEVTAAQQRYKDMAKRAGLDINEAAKAGKEYAEALREVAASANVLYESALVKLLPYFKAFTVALGENIDQLSRWINTTTFEQKIDQLKQGAKDLLSGRSVGSFWESLITGAPMTPGSRKSGGSVTGGAPSATGKGDKFAYLALIEQARGLPRGLLSRIWGKESNYGDPRYMVSSKNAVGHFQFLKDTADDMKVKDRYDFYDSGRGAGDYMQLLMKRYGGHLQRAVAAYNWGMGNTDQKNWAKLAPKETRDYVLGVTGMAHDSPAVYITQQTDISVVAPDARAAGEMVRREQEEINNALVRNSRGAVR